MAQQTPYIEFKKQRELGEILSDAFNFVRSEFKPFFRTIFKVVGPFLLVLLISLSLYLYSFGGLFNFEFQSNQAAFNPVIMFAAVFFFVFSAVATFAMAQSTALSYIGFYVDQKGQVDYEKVRSKAYSRFWSYIGLMFLVGIVLIFGFLLCFIPGIYLYPPMMLTFPILAFTNKGVSESFSYGFTLIKDNWWATFATLLVIGIIVAIIGYVFQIPAVIYMWIKMGVFSGEIDAENMSGGIFDPVYIALNILAYLVQFVLNMVTIVVAAMLYFHLNEKKNFTGTFERIQNLGKTQD